MSYTPRFAGPRWTLLYGSFSGIQKFALEELHRSVQYFLPYVIETLPTPAVPQEKLQGHLLLVGTPQESLLLAELLHRQNLTIPDHPEGYIIAGFASPWNSEHRVVVIAGNQPLGVLYGVEDFNARILATRVMPDKVTPESLRQALDEIKDFAFQEQPRITWRGIWTWGHVIYDYRRLLDHLARLRLNLVTIWDDIPPVNCADVIDYAHNRGIRVFLGFPWGWGMDFDLTIPADRQKIKEMVVDHYSRHIAPLQADGIYFQTLTEHNLLSLGGRSVAQVSCELVNEISSALFALKPDLRIHFGLHATSIREHYSDLASLDRRVTIVWEDAGTLPYTYLPTLEITGEAINYFYPLTFQETLEYSRKLATFRPGTPFGLVPKGWTNLDWPGEFEHHGSFLTGLRSPLFIRKRLEQITPRWARVNALWLQHYQHAIDFYRAILDCSPVEMVVEGLIEDGLLEEKIQPSVALYAETLWDPTQPSQEILARAQSQYCHM